MSLKRPEDQDIVIVGATGDLARRKLLPALYNLFVADLLPAQGRIIGYARTDWSDDQFREAAAAAVKEFSRTGLDAKAWSAFAQRLTYVSAGAGDLAELKRRCTEPARLVYLAVAPSVFASTAHAMSERGMVHGTRLIVEKPFGRDLDSSRELERTLHDVMRLVTLDVRHEADAAGVVLVGAVIQTVFLQMLDFGSRRHGALLNISQGS